AFDTAGGAVPGMKRRKWGRIINICSAHSLRASPFKSAYVTAKHGLAGFTKTLALELAEHGVTANAISPGFVWTPLVEKQIPDLAKSENISLEQAKKQVLSRQPTNQFVTVEEVAALAAFLASAAAASITGANYSIDGGWTARWAAPEGCRYCPAGLRAVSNDCELWDAPLPRSRAAVMKPAAATVSSTAMAISRAHRQARLGRAVAPMPERFAIAQ